jgi:hypothetical protein
MRWCATCLVWDRATRVKRYSGLIAMQRHRVIVRLRHANTRIAPRQNSSLIQCRNKARFWAFCCSRAKRKQTPSGKPCN